jgi:hypothetical protein
MTAETDLLKEVDEDIKAKVPEDKLDFIRDKIRETRDLEFRIADLENQVSELKRVRREAIFDVLPTMFMQIGISHIGISAVGNLPAYDAKLEDHFHAVISSSWPEEKRNDAMRWVHKHKLGDLIKTTVTVELGLGQSSTLKKVLAALKKLRISPRVEENVPWQTLTSYVRERYKTGKPLSDGDLQTIGASVNKVVKLTAVREK